MDALTPFFPDLSRTSSGELSGARGGKPMANGKDVEGESGFAAALLGFLGGPKAIQEAPKTTEFPEGFADSTGTEEVSAEGFADAPGTGEVSAEVFAHSPGTGEASAEVFADAPGTGEVSAEVFAHSPGTGEVSAEVSQSGENDLDNVISSLSPIAPVSGGATVSSVNRDLDNLEPEFRQKLERIVQRMEGEYGHKVDVVEGYRSPERQDALFEQGRTEPGPIVTWTRESLHSQGRAVDLRIDGSWDNPEGYARLQQVAKEEGLQTLGAKDPGHLELPEEGVRSSVKGRGFGWQSTTRFSRPATVAQVARVARPARPGVHIRRPEVRDEERAPKATEGNTHLSALARDQVSDQVSAQVSASPPAPESSTTSAPDQTVSRDPLPLRGPVPPVASDPSPQRDPTPVLAPDPLPIRGPAPEMAPDPSPRRGPDQVFTPAPGAGRGPEQVITPDSSPRRGPDQVFTPDPSARRGPDQVIASDPSLSRGPATVLAPDPSPRRGLDQVFTPAPSAGRGPAPAATSPTPSPISLTQGELASLQDAVVRQEGRTEAAQGTSSIEPTPPLTPAPERTDRRGEAPRFNEGARVSASASVESRELQPRRWARNSEGDDGSFRVSPKAEGQERAIVPQGSGQAVSTSPAGIDGVEAVQRPGSVERVQELQSLAETMNSRVPGRIHLDLENVDGAGTRLRLALTGSQLAGTVDLADPLAIDRMRARVGELHQALGRRGLDAPGLGIQGLKGMVSGGGTQSDLASLLQDPLAGLARVMEARDGAPAQRGDRQSSHRDDPNGEPGSFRNSSRQNKTKEDRR